MSNDINSFFTNLEQEINGIEKGVNSGVKRLTDEAYEEVVSRCNAVNLGGHVGNITKQYDELTNTGTISTDDEVIIFKEYGTGRIGSQTASNHAGMETWEYMTNPSHADGWLYPTDLSDPNPYKFKGKDGKYYAFTHGLESSGMFYETYLNIKKKAGMEIKAEISKIK